MGPGTSRCSLGNRSKVEYTLKIHNVPDRSPVRPFQHVAGGRGRAGAGRGGAFTRGDRRHLRAAADHRRADRRSAGGAAAGGLPPLLRGARFAGDRAQAGHRGGHRALAARGGARPAPAWARRWARRGSPALGGVAGAVRRGQGRVAPLAARRGGGRRARGGGRRAVAGAVPGPLAGRADRDPGPGGAGVAPGQAGFPGGGAPADPGGGRAGLPGQRRAGGPARDPPGRAGRARPARCAVRARGALVPLDVREQDCWTDWAELRARLHYRCPTTQGNAAPTFDVGAA
jgi:hypothetical protein